MSIIFRYLLFISVVAIALTVNKLYDAAKSLPVPEFDTNRYWGRGSGNDYQPTDEIRAQEVFYTDEQIQRIRSKLGEKINFLRPLEDLDHEYGMNTYQLHSILEYWRDDYLPRFNETQTFLNSVPHFLTHLHGSVTIYTYQIIDAVNDFHGFVKYFRLNVHFIHVKPEIRRETTKSVVPILLLHGWTNTVREFYDLISLLTQPNDDTDYYFEVVVPSLAGFGWSESPAKEGFNAVEQSIVFRDLMFRLGHDNFYVHASEMSSVIGSTMAILFPDNVIGLHSTLCTVPTYLSLAKSLLINAMPSYFDDSTIVNTTLFEQFSFLVKESGLTHLQATKPDTIGIVLSDNPIGLAAVILEKFSSFFDTIDRDTILDNLTIYALTNCFVTSARFHAEAFSSHDVNLQTHRVPILVPTGCASFRKNIVHYTDWQLSEKYKNLVQSTNYETGGPFAAMEVPALLYQDLLSFVNIVQKKQ